MENASGWNPSVQEPGSRSGGTRLRWLRRDNACHHIQRSRQRKRFSRGKLPGTAWYWALLSTLGSLFHSRAALELENLALGHQIGVPKRSARKRPKLTSADRVFLGVADAGLVRLALGAGDRETRDGDRLAPPSG